MISALLLLRLAFITDMLLSEKAGSQGTWQHPLSGIQKQDTMSCDLQEAELKTMWAACVETMWTCEAHAVRQGQGNLKIKCQ